MILSADQYDRSRLSTVTVVVATTTTQLGALPGNVRIPVDLGVLEQESVINVTQISTIDRGALEQRIDVLPDWLLAQLDAGVRRALDLSRV